MSSVIISGDTSGSVTLQAPAIAGTTTVTLPVTSMNIGNGGGGIATNTAIGTSALGSNTSGSSNVAVGNNALVSNTTATDNTAVGKHAGYSTTTASANTFIGSVAGYANTTGNGNSVLGYAALNANTTGSQNTAIGRSSATTNTTGIEITAVGFSAMGNCGTAADYCTAIGRAALNNTTGAYNTAIGNGSGSAITSGTKNTILGCFSGNQFSLNLSGSSNNIVLADGDGKPRQVIDSSSQVKFHQNGYDTYRNGIKQSGFGYSPGSYGALVLGAIADNQTVCINYDPSGNNTGGFAGTGGEMLFKRGITFLTPNSANTSFYQQFSMTDGVTSGDFNDTSDVALKTNIQSIETALQTISQLRPVTFEWKQEGKGSRSGFIAQEVELVLPNDVIGEDYVEPNRETGELGTSGKSINTTGIVAHLVKAVQELNAKVIELEAKLESK
jgi:hypothetical protein